MYPFSAYIVNVSAYFEVRSIQGRWDRFGDQEINDEVNQPCTHRRRHRESRAPIRRGSRTADVTVAF